jgi:ergothioneine biosynthesis protein EgtB
MLTKTSSNTRPTESLLDAFRCSRKYSVDLIAGLSPEDCQAQSMEDTSPAKWHLAHVTWFYEVMVLKSFEKNFKYWNPQFAVLFNSYYNSVGDKHPRKHRGLLTRPSLKEVLDWRINIESRVEALILENSTPELSWVIELGINHEQQHQELLLTDIHHLFYQNSLLPAYSPLIKSTKVFKKPFQWLEGISGVVEVGFKGDGFHFDNESPSHSVFNQSYFMANQLVTNAQWRLFIEDGGYQDSQWWLDAGWAWVRSEDISAPLYWSKDHKNQYLVFSLHGNSSINSSLPVSNISYFEAEAFSRWADKKLEGFKGARLPTEFEWETFSRDKKDLVVDLFGQVWQWTSSNYNPYPRYQPWEGNAGEYNGKFMINQMVLRGSSAYTTEGHSREAYRNFFPTHTRWQMTGLRLAKDGV